MKLLDVNWANVLENFWRYSNLSVPARSVLLATIKPSGYTRASDAGEHLREVVESGIPTYDEQRQRLVLAEPHRELLKVIRAMNRHRVFDDPGMRSLQRYMDDHFSMEDVYRLSVPASRYGYPGVAKHQLASRVASAGWPGDLLAARSDDERLAWAADRGEQDNSASARDLLRGLQQLTQLLVLANAPVSLDEWFAALPEAERQRAAAILHLGLRTVVLFVAMRSHDLVPLLGVWPEAAVELVRPPAQPPSEVTPVAQFNAALLMEDMSALLVTMVASPVRVRANDLKVFARTAADMETRLVVIPPWAESIYSLAGGTRVDMTARFLQWHEFAALEARHGNPHLVSTDAGATWLALSPHDRLQALLDPMRNSSAKNPRGMYEPSHIDSFFSFTLPYLHEPKGLNLRDSVTKIFLGVGEGFYTVQSFLDFASRTANPFLAMNRDEMQALHRQLHMASADPRDAFRLLWHNAVFEFLRSRLLLLGGATLGVANDGALCFSLTPIGRYLLGDANEFSYGDSGTTDIIVQPNFDIVFLGASPSLEASIARVAERTGTAPGLAFVLTRASVIRAAESGMSADDVLSMLHTASSKPVPQNVQREVRGWMSHVRRAQLRTVEVVDAGDEETADRVVAVLGNKAIRLTGTLVELPSITGSARAALLKKLKAGGILLDDQTGKATAASRGRRWRG